MFAVPPKLPAVADRSASNKAYPLTQDYGLPTDPDGAFNLQLGRVIRAGASPSGLHRPRLAVGAFSVLLGSVIVFINLNIDRGICQMFFQSRAPTPCLPLSGEVAFAKQMTEG